MTGWLRKPLSRGEVTGYFVFLAGFILLQVRGGFQDPLVEVAAMLMAVGLVIAGRAGAARSPAV